MQKGFEVLKVSAPHKNAVDGILQVGDTVSFTYEEYNPIGKSVKAEASGVITSLVVTASQGSSSLRADIKLDDNVKERLLTEHELRVFDTIRVSAHKLVKIVDKSWTE